MLEQRQLALFHTVIVRNGSAIRNGAEHTIAVNHVFAHQVNLAVTPRTSGRFAVCGGVGKVNALGKHMTAESRLDRGLGLFQTLGVHLRAYISTRGDVGVVHHMIVQTGIRDKNDMVFGTTGITAVQIVVKSGNAVVHATDSPVVTDVHIIECTRRNSGILRRGYGTPERLAPIDRIVRPCVIEKQRSDLGFRTLNGLCFEIGKGNLFQTSSIVNRNHMGIAGCGDRTEFGHFLSFNADCTHWLYLLIFPVSHDCKAQIIDQQSTAIIHRERSCEVILQDHVFKGRQPFVKLRSLILQAPCNIFRQLAFDGIKPCIERFLLLTLIGSHVFLIGLLDFGKRGISTLFQIRNIGDIGIVLRIGKRTNILNNLVPGTLKELFLCGEICLELLIQVSPAFQHGHDVIEGFIHSVCVLCTEEGFLPIRVDRNILEGHRSV
nr:MAG TPA: hypothetical protein [Caudoviricetes sp.]